MTAPRRVQLRLARHVHPVYREQLHAVPPGWRYTYTDPALADDSVGTKKIVQSAGRFGGLSQRLDAAALWTSGVAGYVHRVRPRRLPDTDLIHSGERLLHRSPVPYVLDLEHVELFVLYQRRALSRPWTRAWLEHALLDERLRFLLPWSDAARRSVLEAVSRRARARLEPKLRVVYPAVRANVETSTPPAAGPLRILFIGTKFYEKGGVEAIQAVRAARTSHEVELDIVSFAPARWAQELRDEPGIRLLPPGGAQLIRDLYSRNDVLLFPSHMDTFGVVVGEAMSFGLSVLAPSHLALTEIVEHGKTGWHFAPENMLYGDDTRCRFPSAVPTPERYLEALRSPSPAYVRGVAEAVVALAEDRALVAQLGAGALESVRTGRLSMERRREALGEIYDAAVA